jgi:hypothetical protein
LHQSHIGDLDFSMTAPSLSDWSAHSVGTEEPLKARSPSGPPISTASRRPAKLPRAGWRRAREEALAAIQEAITIRREPASRWPDAYQRELEQ